MDVERIKRLQELMLEKRNLDGLLKETNREIAELEERVLEDMASEGVTGVRCGNRMMYMYEQAFVSVAPGEDRLEVAQRLKAAGLGVYIKEDFNLNSLSAHYRRTDEEPIKGLVKTVKYRIGMSTETKRS